AGKFDIGAFAVIQAQPTPDQKLDFVARATDGDGDFKTASFSIGIDGTGIYDDGQVAGVPLPQLASSIGSGAGPAVLTDQLLQSVVAQAIDQWRAAGVDPQSLSALEQAPIHIA